VRLPSPLYVILDRSVARGRDLPDLLRAVLAGGCRLVQLREKTMPLDELLVLARGLARQCREAGALFIVNDRAGQPRDGAASHIESEFDQITVGSDGWTPLRT